MSAAGGGGGGIIIAIKPVLECTVQLLMALSRNSESTLIDYKDSILIFESTW